jgi:hypothetical protein
MAFGRKTWQTEAAPAVSAGIDEDTTGMKIIAIVLGLVFAVLAAFYWITPAGSLPEFFPGFEAGSVHVHVKHGAVAAVLAIVLLGFGFFARGSRA